LHSAECNGIDAIVHTPGGTWAGIEVTLGGTTAIDAGAGAASLRAAAKEIRDQPAFLAVITANGQYAYRRNDGIDVIPLATLGP